MRLCCGARPLKENAAQKGISGEFSDVWEHEGRVGVIMCFEKIQLNHFRHLERMFTLTTMKLLELVLLGRPLGNSESMSSDTSIRSFFYIFINYLTF